jgi:uncharacterized protein (DUF2236 family)
MWVKDRIALRVRALFAHVDYPLAHSLDYTDDPGLFGPGSASWQIVGDPAAMIGGIRALLIQAAHPEVVQGVREHSHYQDDPLGRLSRTTAYVTAATYGAMPEVESAVDRVRKAHTPVTGVSHRGRPYAANNPDHAAWVHNVLTDSFLAAFTTYGPASIPAQRSNLFVSEQTRLGRMLNATDLPSTAPDLSAWIEQHPDIGRSPGLEDAVTFLRRPPLPFEARGVYAALFQAAVGTIPESVASILGVRARPGSVAIGRQIVGFLRWSLGSSPSWWLALQRTAAEAPPSVTFLRPPPAEGAQELFSDRAPKPSGPG